MPAIPNLNNVQKKITLVAQILLGLGIAFYTILVIHDFFKYIDYIYLAADDGLANISYVLATEGRYGFLSSPLQAPNSIPRHNGFFNYGPWYFYLGAGLIWLFGYSLTLLRTIHLLIILLAVVAAYLWFRQEDGRVAAALFALALLYCFDTIQWPMVRPDSMVAFFALLLVIFSSLAIKTQQFTYWFFAGLSASCGAFSHLIAWSLIPASMFIFFSSQFFYWKKVSDSKVARHRKFGWNLLAIVSGGAAGIFMFYASFDFRIQDHLATLKAYQSFVVHGTQASLGTTSYGKVLLQHTQMAFSYLAYNVQVGLWLMLPVGWGLMALSIQLWQNERSTILAYLLPPLTVWSLYVLSLGNYPNFHAGYTILTQVMAFWSIASIIYVVLYLIRIRLQSAGALVSLGITVLLLVSGLSLVGQKLSSTPTYKSNISKDLVSISSYLNEILNPLPQGTYAWGTQMYGIENPGRIQLIQFGEGVTLASNVAHTNREAIAPDYIIWGYPENRDSTLATLQKTDNPWQNLASLFPNYRYELASIVVAPPYGVTRVYQRRAITEPLSNNQPLVSVYQPSFHQWNRKVGSRLDTTFAPTFPVRIQIGYQTNPPQIVADETISTTLPAGDYLLRVKLKTNPQDVNSRLLAVTSSPQVKQTISELGPDFDRTPYSAYDQEAFLIHHHSGGQIYVSQFDSSSEAGILAVEVYPVEGLTDYTVERQEKTFKPLPAPTQWKPDEATRVKVTAVAGGSLVEGNSSQLGYQITSPSIPVKPHSQIVLRLRSKIEKGKVCIGVLNQNAQEWIIPPTTLKKEYKLDSKNNQAMFVVFANCNSANTGNDRSRFILYDGAYSVWSEKFYTDELMNARRKR
jgi:hypothetical protein